MGKGTHGIPAGNSAVPSQSADAALAQIRVALHTGADARVIFDALRLDDPATAQAVAHALAVGAR